MIHHSKPTIIEDDINVVANVLRSTHLENGGVVEELEREFCQYFDRKYAVAVSSGFAAIHLSLIALGVSSDDEVIIPSYACSALLNPILILNANPIVVDIESNSFNISVDEVKNKITKRTRAIIVPHLFGIPARIDELKDLGIPIIEDCAQAVGGYYNNKKIGTFGDITIFSFYATKMLTGGDGGLIICDNNEIFKSLINHRYYGHKRMHKYLAYNYQMTNLPAALIKTQFFRINSFVERRKEIATIYDEMFSKENDVSVEYDNKSSSCFYRYPLMFKNKDIEAVKSKMLEKGVQCGYGVLEGLHQLLDLDIKDFPNTENKLKTTLSIPIYPSLSDEEVVFVANSLINILK